MKLCKSEYFFYIFVLNVAKFRGKKYCSPHRVRARKKLSGRKAAILQFCYINREQEGFQRLQIKNWSSKDFKFTSAFGVAEEDGQNKRDPSQTGRQNEGSNSEKTSVDCDDGTGKKKNTWTIFILRESSFFKFCCRV